MAECSRSLAQLSEPEKKNHVVACIKTLAGRLYVEQSRSAYVEAQGREDGKLSCPLEGDICACRDEFTYSDLAFHLYTRVLQRRLMWNQFSCMIEDCGQR